MVAAKKPVKKATKVKPTAKKTTRRATVNKSTKKVSGSKPELWPSLRLARETRPFMSFSITKQTMIWITLMLVIIVLQVIILVQMTTTSNIIDQVEQSLNY